MSWVLNAFPSFSILINIIYFPYSLKRLDSMISQVFSNLNDSTMLWSFSRTKSQSVLFNCLLIISPCMCSFFLEIKHHHSEFAFFPHLLQGFEPKFLWSLFQMFSTAAVLVPNSFKTEFSSPVTPDYTSVKLSSDKFRFILTQLFLLNCRTSILAMESYCLLKQLVPLFNWILSFLECKAQPHIFPL